MIEKKQKNISFWTLFIIFLLVILFIALLTSNRESQANNTQTSTQPSTPVYTVENCVHDLAIRYANAVKRDIDNGVPFSDTKMANQLSEYERQKSECYK